jgi:hypothetical protein
MPWSLVWDLYMGQGNAPKPLRGAGPDRPWSGSELIVAFAVLKGFYAGL